MGYENLPPKLTFYKAFFSAQWKFLIHTIVQCMSAKRTAWNEFSSSMASVDICLATGRKFNYSKYIFDSMVRNVDSPSKFLMYLWFLQVMINAQVDDLSSHNTKYTSPALTQKVFANMRRIGKGFSGVETPLFDTMLVQPQVQDAAEVDVVDEDDNEMRMEEDVTAVKEINDVEPTVFDDEEVTMTMAQTLIKMKAKKERLLDEQMAKRLQDEEIEQAATREKQEKEDLERAKVLQQQYDQKEENIDSNIVAEQMQEKHLDNIMKDEEPTKKRGAKETLLQESFKKLRAEVKASEKDYPLSNQVITLMLSSRLQIEEDSEVARDLTMFMANLSLADQIYDEADPSYDSNILSEEQNKVVNESLTVELARYEEQVTIYEKKARSELTEREQRIDEQLRIITTDVISTTKDSGSKPRSNKKKNRILPAKSDNKKKVEDHPRNNKSNLKQKNRVDSSISSKRTKPTRRKFTLGEQCPLTRFTKSKVVPSQQPKHVSSSDIVITKRYSNTSQKPLTRYTHRNKHEKAAFSNGISTTAETQSMDASMKY
nr:hypothetical protein [Tanacetum cinerariifolium]